MPRIPRLPTAVTSNAVPIAVALGGAFLLRRLIGAAVSVLAMLAVGRVLLTALKIDLALAERREKPTPRVVTAASTDGGGEEVGSSGRKNAPVQRPPDHGPRSRTRISSVVQDMQQVGPP